MNKCHKIVQHLTSQKITMTTTKTDYNSELAALGFALESSGPLGGADSENWPHIAYTVTLSFNGRQVIQTAYKLGIGHVDIKGTAENDSRLLLSDDERSMLRSWKLRPHAQFVDRALQAHVAAKLARVQMVRPDLADVLHSLLLDGQAYTTAKTFEDWAGDFGYDPDSRKAEAIFRECDAIGRKLAANVPAATLEKAREILLDY